MRCRCARPQLSRKLCALIALTSPCCPVSPGSFHRTELGQELLIYQNAVIIAMDFLTSAASS